MPSGSSDRTFLVTGTVNLGPGLSHAERFLSVPGITPTAAVEGVHSFPET